MLVPFTTRADLLRAASAGLYDGVWSPWIVAETWRVLTWRWAKQSGLSPESWRAISKSANAMFELLDESLHLSVPRRPFPAAWPALGDPNDEPVFAAAISSSCDVIVSDNTRDFPPGGSWAGVTCRRAADFLIDIGWQIP